MLPQHQRLSRNEVVRVLQRGTRMVHPLLSFHSIRRQEAGDVRAAVVVSKKVAQHAAARNLLRRRTYALIRAHSTSLAGCDVVVQLRPAARGASYAALARVFGEIREKRQEKRMER